MTSRYHYASCFGSLWRLTHKQWEAFLLKIVEVGAAGLGDYGEHVGSVSQVTDMDRGEALEALHSARRARLKKPKVVTIMITRSDSDACGCVRHGDHESLIVDDDGGGFDGDEIHDSADSDTYAADADEAAEDRREHYYALGHDVTVVRS